MGIMCCVRKHNHGAELGEPVAVAVAAGRFVVDYKTKEKEHNFRRNMLCCGVVVCSMPKIKFVVTGGMLEMYRRVA